MSARSSRHEITLKEAMGSIDSGGFADALDDELANKSYSLSLDEDYCTNGGSIGEVEISEVKLDPYTREDAEITGSFDISFEESYSSGCRDIEWSEGWSGTASFTIERISGRMQISIDAERVYDEEDADEEEAS